MKIIFLDFDGPLSNERTQAQTGDWWNFDPVACQALNNICAASGAKIVASSTRAIDNQYSFRETCSLFEEAGLDVRHLHSDWCIRNKNQYSGRGKGFCRETLIRRWLRKHPEVSTYCIIDDEKVRMPNFVQVSGVNGILSEHFDRIANCLGLDLADIFQDARERRGDFFETQYKLPFDAFYERWNASI